MSRTSNSNGVLAARERFFSTGERPTGLVSNVILESWQRCAARGMPAQGRPEVAPPTPSQLHEIQDRYEALRRLCRPELEALHASASAAGSIAILTGPNGLVLDAVGDAGFLDKAARVSLRPGVPWTEGATGTNAIGTAMVERRPVEVRGGEHYFEPYRFLSCSAAPILDPFGQLAGLLDLSGHSSVHHVHALGMVQLAVDQIEHRLFDEASAGRMFVRLHSDPALLDTPREGLLMFEGHRLVAANRHALALLGLDWGELGKRRYDELFSGALPKVGAVANLRDHLGNLLHVSMQARPGRGSGATAVPVSSPSPAPRTSALRTPAPVLDSHIIDCLRRATRLLEADIPVLLQGETGCGKEVFARELHKRGSRSSAPFIAINCAALPESLIEAELFGYLPGAFTGARREGSRGLLREADGGVLFLDEIGDMPLPLQGRLLRVLQEREVAALGGGRATPVDFALIAASHRDLRAAVEAQTFRGDLYYRIAQSCVRLPPLREYGDLRGLVERLWCSLGAEAASLRLDTQALDALAVYHWPGNFRQLVGALRTLIALADPGTTVTRAMLPDLPGLALSGLDLPGSDLHGADPAQAPVAAKKPRATTLEAVELDAMREAFAAARGNASEAARRLGISRSTLYRRLRIER